MKYKTFDQWKKEGESVRKGETSHKRNKAGDAVFSEDQLAWDPPEDLGYGYLDDDWGDRS